MTDKPEEGALTDVARAIGSTLGQAKIQADQMLEGMKAMAKASADAYARRSRSKKKAATKTKSARGKSKPSARRTKKKSGRKKSR